MRECAAIAQNEFLARNIDERDEVIINNKTLSYADGATISSLGNGRQGDNLHLGTTPRRDIFPRSLTRLPANSLQTSRIFTKFEMKLCKNVVIIAIVLMVAKLLIISEMRNFFHKISINKLIQPTGMKKEESTKNGKKGLTNKQITIWLICILICTAVVLYMHFCPMMQNVNLDLWVILQDGKYLYSA